MDMIREGGCGLSFWGGHLEIVHPGRLRAALRRHNRNDDLQNFHSTLQSFGFVLRVGISNSYDAPAGVKDVDHILFLYNVVRA